MQATLPLLKDRPWLRNRHVQKLFTLYHEAGAELRIVGGAVRNGLLSRPVRDIDMAIDRSPRKVIEIAEDAGLTVIPTGIDHGTVTIIMGQDPVRRIEITSLRADIETDGRHAKVAYTDNWMEDASRRDFTINALYCSSDGAISDPLGGMDDITAERVRFIGDAEERVQEDYLRILRFFRFSAEYGDGALDAQSLVACEKLKYGLDNLSVERIGQEFLRLIEARECLSILKVMKERSIYDIIFQDRCDFIYLESVMEFELTFGLAPQPLRRLAALFLPAYHDGSMSAGLLQEKLSLSSKQRHHIQKLWELSSALPKQLSAENIKQYLYKWGSTFSLDMMSLSYAKDRCRCEKTWLHHLFFDVGYIHPVFPLGGDDLIARGMKPGPELGAELKRLEEIWMMDGFTLTREQLLSQSA